MFNFIAVMKCCFFFLILSALFNISILPVNVNRFRYHLFILLLLFLCIPASAQDTKNIHLEKVQEEGLYNDYVVCINQDANGFIWFGTREGLFRYDGYVYKDFRNIPGDSTTLANNNIQFIYPERNYLWVGTSVGLSRIDINNQSVTNIPSREFLQMKAILPKNDSVFWLGTSGGLFQFNKKNSQFKRVAGFGKNVYVNSMCDDKKGHLYIAAVDGFYAYTIATGVCKHYRPDLPTYPMTGKDHPIVFRKAVMGDDGNLWMGTWDAGLVRFNTKTEQIKVWSHQTDDVHLIPYKIITDLLFDNYNNLWIANKEGGLTIYNTTNDKFTNYPVEWKNDNKLSGGVLSLFRDRSGIVWIGAENGVYKYDPHSVYLSRTDLLLKTDSGLTQAHIAPQTILKDRDDTWWMGMYEGLFIFDPKNGVLTDCNQQFGIPKSSAVFNIIQDNQGTIWATAKNMLLKISKKSGSNGVSYQSEIFQSPDIKSSMFTLYIDRENRMWIGTHSNGIFRFDPASKKFISCKYDIIGPRGAINEIRTFCELSRDSILVAGEHTGLYLLHVNSNRYEKISWDNTSKMAPGASINKIYKNDNDVWIGTEFNGLWQTDTHLKKPVLITVNDGLPSMSIGLISRDRYNNIWLMTGAGAVAVQMPDKKITVFDKKDGIQNLNELGAMVIDNNDNISIGGRGAVYNLNPAAIVKNNKPPEVSIIDLKIFDKDYTIHKGETVKLDYDQNYFTLQYVALNYTHSRLNKYAYKMAGLDKKWNLAGARRYVSYANLDEGTYTFYVKACNNEGVWANVPAKLILIIKPPFWHRWWFYLLIAMLVLSGIYIAYRYNLNQFRIRLQLRDKIARDLHDDIGSTLSGINIFSKIALQKIDSDRQGSKDLLEKISTRSEKTLDALSDIVWSINTRNDGLDNFLAKAREYLTEVLEASGIAYEIEASSEMESLKLGMAVRKEMYLIFKEAVYNASKYAGCSLIKISLTKNKDTCKLIICDNGKGFDMNEISTGNGIHNMQHRAKKINAVLDIETGTNKGTCITLVFHIPRFR